MSGRSTINIKSIFLLVLILTGFAYSLYSQDKKIGDIINLYKHVEAIGSAPRDNVTLNDVSNLFVGDTVLLIQMKGAVINVPEDGNFGSYKDLIGLPGLSEFLIIESINAGAKNVVFTSIILNNFDVSGIVQLVRVPFYNSATVTSTLTCQPWDSVTKTGGVLTMIIGRTLSLDADIDVSGKGFKGGKTSPGDGLCSTGLNNFGYPESNPNSGYKGESPATRAFVDLGNIPPVFPDYAKGKGANFTGGGGGNGKYSGGGGGSNWALTGGKGGKENPTCAPNNDGGIGGLTIKFTDLDAGFFMGGGGGASTYETGNTTATPGGNGGGIIIIICDTLKGNGKIITAEGGSPNTYPKVSGNAGAGGGGGGGSVALYLQSYSSGSTGNLTISVKGGNGGNTSNAYGEGGGGGGGLILTNNITPPANVSRNYTGGLGGTRSPGTTYGSSGSDGGTLNNYSPVLNGFLFNSIRSAVTGDQTDSICSNVSFGIISGTIPFGGTTPYTLLWEYSTTSESAGFSPAPGTNNQRDYSPGILTQTTWFRRKVTDSGAPVLVDISKPVKIIVQPFIKNNIIGDPDTVCYAQNPATLISKGTLQDGNGIYYFRWKVSTDNSVFTYPANNDSTENYTPEPALKYTSWYKRTVTSGRCVDSTAIVRINVLDTISNNKILSPPQDICFGSVFNDLTATTISTTPALAGGDNSYKFLWESSINGVAWGPAPGINNQTGYAPVELPERVPMNEYKFRRVVKSGAHDVCVSTTPILLLRDYPVLTNNNIVTSVQKICAGSVPALLVGSDPQNGNGTYTYIWQDSSKAHTWTDISSSVARDYQPPALTDTTSYRRKVSSSACFDISKSVRINVHKIIANNSITLLSGLTDTTICDGANPNRFKGTTPTGGTNIAGDYAYEWLFSTDNSTWNPVASAGTLQGYDPPALNSTTYYKRKVLSGACTDISASTIKVTVLPLIGNNVLNTPAVICKGYLPAVITGSTPTGGDGNYKYLWEQSTDGGTTWTAAAGVNNGGDYQPPALSVPTKYKRIVTSGANDCCQNVSTPVEILIHTVPSSIIDAGPDTTFNSVSYRYHMQATPPAVYETGLWKTLSGSTDIIDSTLFNTEVLNLKSKNVYSWTVTNGPCISKDTVTINVNSYVIPNGFSPNGDGTNDYFEILGLDIYELEVELSIVNSAGTEVFHTTNKNGPENWINWDGTNSSGAPLSEGTYYYILYMKPKDDPDKPPIKEPGYVVLKRR
jgi:gliding motility-associated-like protein